MDQGTPRTADPTLATSRAERRLALDAREDVALRRDGRTTFGAVF